MLLVFALPVNATSVSDLVRVGITDNKFQNVLRQNIKLYGTAECDICDKLTHRVLMHVDADADIVVQNGISGMQVTVGNQNATLRDFVVICPSGLLGVRDLKRKGQPAIYHGAFEVVQKPDHTGFYLVNIVEIHGFFQMKIAFHSQGGLEAFRRPRNFWVVP